MRKLLCQLGWHEWKFFYQIINCGPWHPYASMAECKICGSRDIPKYVYDRMWPDGLKWNDILEKNK